MDELVIATGNPHKVQELRAIFAEQGIAVIGLQDLPGPFREPSETGRTFEDNATIKALSYAGQTGRLCLADDSGLEVDALGGRPGVISSHYSTEGVETGLTREERDAANNRRLLKELEGIPPGRRGARFVCVMCVAGPPDSGGIGVPPVGKPRPSTLLSVGPELAKSGRTLPHWEQGGKTYFVTFRTIRGELTAREREQVLSACVFWHGTRMRLHVGVVMPDHVHLLLTPLPDPAGGWFSLARLAHSIKSFTSHEIGRVRGAGQLWEAESYDRIVRTLDEFEEKRKYIWQNPVRAGLVGKPADYPFLAAPEWTLEQRMRTEAAALRRPSLHPHRRDAYTTTSENAGGRDDSTISRVLATSRGTFEGRIGLPGDVPRGDNGFGYDPLFLLPPPDTRASAELTAEDKNRLSHRGAAARQIAVQLSDLL